LGRGDGGGGKEGGDHAEETEPLLYVANLLPGEDRLADCPKREGKGSKLKGGRGRHTKTGKNLNKS